MQALNYLLCSDVAQIAAQLMPVAACSEQSTTATDTAGKTCWPSFVRALPKYQIPANAIGSLLQAKNKDRFWLIILCDLPR